MSLNAGGTQGGTIQVAQARGEVDQQIMRAFSLGQLGLLLRGAADADARTFQSTRRPKRRHRNGHGDAAWPQAWQLVCEHTSIDRTLGTLGKWTWQCVEWKWVKHGETVILEMSDCW